MRWLPGGSAIVYGLLASNTDIGLKITRDRQLFLTGNGEGRGFGNIIGKHMNAYPSILHEHISWKRAKTNQNHTEVKIF